MVKPVAGRDGPLGVLLRPRSYLNALHLVLGHFKHFMGHAPTWKGIAYLLLRFPAGIATFTIAVTLVATSLAMTFAPTYAWTSDDVTWGSWTFDAFWWSFLLVPVGIALVFVSLHLMNALATACAKWTRWSIGRPQPTEPAAPTIHRYAA